MKPEQPTTAPDARLTFLRVVIRVWVALVMLTLLGAWLAPHFGSMADFVLHQTVYRGWIQMTLEAEQPFFDLSTPLNTVKSYYSSLYQSDAGRMEGLTQGSFRAQMRVRMQSAGASVAPTGRTYRSYMYADMHNPQQATVVEKFHLFWTQGLRFSIQRGAADWQILGVEPAP